MNDCRRFRFGEFVLDEQEAELTLRGQIVPLAPKEFQLLCLLVSQAGHLIRKEFLVRELWPDTFVTDSSLLRNVSMLRRHLGRDSIRTVKKRGYIFAIPVSQLPRKPFRRNEGEVHSQTKSEEEPTEETHNRPNPSPMRPSGSWIPPLHASLLLVIGIAAGISFTLGVELQKHGGIARLRRPQPRYRHSQMTRGTGLPMCSSLC